MKTDRRPEVRAPDVAEAEDRDRHGDDGQDQEKPRRQAVHRVRQRETGRLMHEQPNRKSQFRCTQYLRRTTRVAADATAEPRNATRRAAAGRRHNASVTASTASRSASTAGTMASNPVIRAGPPSQFLQHAAGADEVVVEDPSCDLEQLADGGVAKGVSHRLPFLRRRHDVLVAEDGELLRHDRLVEFERLLQFLHGVITPDEDFENLDADRVRQGAEELGLEGPELVHRAATPLYMNIHLSRKQPDRRRHLTANSPTAAR